METSKETTSTQSRWRSPVLWTALAAQIVVLCKVTGLWEAIGIEDSVVSDVVAGVIQALVIVGVLNNPTNGEGF